MKIYLATSHIIMYSYAVTIETSELDALIATAESGDTKTAREGVLQFIQKYPSTLLAWKLLADIAGNAKERSMAIHRAQLLAPGDPWVIEAKKHRLPQIITRDNAQTDSATVSQKHSGSVDGHPIDVEARYEDETLTEYTSAHHGKPPRWPMWLAATLAAAGIVLIAAAWRLGPF